MARMDVPNAAGSGKNTKVCLVVNEQKYMKFKTKWAKGRLISAHGTGGPDRIRKTKLIKLKGRINPYVLVEFADNWFNITNSSAHQERATKIKFSPDEPPRWRAYNVRIGLHKNENGTRNWNRKWCQDRYNGFTKISKDLLPFLAIERKITVYSEPDPKLRTSKLK